MKPLIIYHANCADGFGAAFAAWLKFGDEADYVPVKYGQDFEPSCLSGVEKREIYVIDFSFSKEETVKLFKYAKRVVWLDHHKTAFEMWCGAIPAKSENGDQHFMELDTDLHIHLNNNKSGAMLAWEYFHPDKEVPMLIKHIDDYDRWQFKIKGTKEFNKALWSYAPWSFSNWEEFFLIIGESRNIENELTLKQFYIEGAAILRAHEANVKAVVEGTATGCCIYVPVYDNTSDTYKHFIGNKRFFGIAANCPPHLASDVGHQLANKSGAYGLLWHVDKEGKCKCSIRSNGSYDVSAIAKAFGGGGHKNAAGFEVDIQTLLGWIK